MLFRERLEDVGDGLALRLTGIKRQVWVMRGIMPFDQSGNGSFAYEVAHGGLRAGGFRPILNDRFPH